MIQHYWIKKSCLYNIHTYLVHEIEYIVTLIFPSMRSFNTPTTHFYQSKKKKSNDVNVSFLCIGTYNIFGPVVPNN